MEQETGKTIFSSVNPFVSEAKYNKMIYYFLVAEMRYN